MDLTLKFLFLHGESNHCMDLMGLDEQKGIHAAVDIYKSIIFQWRGIIGKSYVVSPWSAAMGSTSKNNYSYVGPYWCT